ncbi:hypothetical protein [Lentibacillus kimchii]|uniref:Uncharacterized protein n=1 Tax=Lentibacillus kimchii TaxID=1542911 RepID=A0ABW2UUH9_9BACI
MATFDQSLYVELALSAIEMKGVPNEDILAVPLDNRTEERKLFDTIYRSDGFSMFDIAAALATAFSVIGASAGFQLTWGPIIWGLIGAVVGAAAGFLIKLFMNRKKQKHTLKLSGKASELILIVYCKSEQVDIIEDILWDNFALGIAKMDDISHRS